LDKGEGKIQQHIYIIDNQMQLGYPPAELPTDKPTIPSAYGTGLDPPTFQLTGQPVLGKDRTKHRKEHKNKQRMTQATQPKTTYWETHKGEVQLSEDTQVTSIQKCIVPKQACPTPSCSSNTQRVRNMWMPGKNRQTMDEGRDMGSGGTRTTSICTIG
jgi:hypothetical protein